MPSREQFRPAREAINRAGSNRAPRNLSFPVTDDDYGILFIFRDYKYTPSSQRGFSDSSGSNAADTIFLPLPANISDSFQIRVQRFDQGIGGEAVSTALSEVDIENLGLGTLTGSIMGSLSGMLPGVRGDNLGEIMNNISSDLAFLTRRAVDNVAPNQGRNIDAGTGTFVNPKAALSFEGVEMKIHNFDWTLIPRTEQESENLRQIANTIKRNILPSYVNTSVVQRTMFKYPSMVDVFFVGIDPDHYYYFKTCMVQTFTVNYTPNGNAVLREGRPAAVQMQMNIIETDIHTSEDYGGSGTNAAVDNFDLQNLIRLDQR
jgi:hypothetical protein